MCGAVGGAGDAGCVYAGECQTNAAAAGSDLPEAQSGVSARLPSWIPTAGCGHEWPALRSASAAFARHRYFAAHYHRRGRQLGRVLATGYEEVVVDRLFAGNVQLVKALQPLVEAAEKTLQLDAARRARTIIRVDAGAGTLDDINWRLSRGYEVLAKEYSGQRVLRLAKTVTEWVQDPDWSERSFGWVTEPPTGYVRPVQRIAGRCRRQDGPLAYWGRFCRLSARQVVRVLKA